MTEIVVARAVLLHLQPRPVDRIQKNHVRTEEGLFNLRLRVKDKIKQRRALRGKIVGRRVMRRVLSGSKNAKQVIRRAVAGNKFVFDD